MSMLIRLRGWDVGMDPSPCQQEYEAGWTVWRRYFYDSILSFDASLYAGLGDLHIKVLAFDIARDGCSDVEI